MDPQTAYAYGNASFHRGDIEEAAFQYGAGITTCNPHEDKEILKKLLLNRALCSLKTRSYDDVVRDCSSVLLYDKHNLKGLIRRATAYEYMGEFSKGLADVRKVLNDSDNLPAPLLKTCNDLMLRLSKYDRLDNSVINKEPLNQSDCVADHLNRDEKDLSKASKGKLVTGEQCLRINVLEYNLDNAKKYSMASFPVPLHLRVCMGNEFGLWNQQYMLKETLIPTQDQDAVQMKCTLLDLSGRDGTKCNPICILDTLNDVADVRGKENCVYAPVDSHGRAEFDAILSLNHTVFNTLSDSNAPIVLAVKIECVGVLPCGIHGSSVIPVLTLPITITYSTDHSTVGTPLLGGAADVHAQCMREVNLSDVLHGSVDHNDVPCGIEHPSKANELVFVLESPGYYGIAGKIWDSTFVLLSYLYKCDQEVRSMRREISNLSGDGHAADANALIFNKNVLELGCGTGITGIGLKYLSPLSVSMTDLEEVVPLIEANISMNILPSDKLYGSMRSFAMPWGLPMESTLKLAEDTLVPTSNCFSTPPIQTVLDDVDTIIASDVVYDPTYYRALVDSIVFLLTYRKNDGDNPNVRKDRVVVLAHRHRHPEDHKFFDMLDALSDTITVVIEKHCIHNHKVRAQTDPRESSTGDSKIFNDVKILKIRLKKSESAV